MLPGTEVRGTVSSIRLGSKAADGGQPHHVLVSRADAGVMPEGTAISPDQRWVATTNLERSAQPFGDQQQVFFSSVTLLRLVPRSGVLERVGDFPFDGLLPEAAVFDNTSRFLAVTCFSHFDGLLPEGSIDFWRVSGDYADPRRAELVMLRFSVPVARGSRWSWPVDPLVRTYHDFTFA